MLYQLPFDKLAQDINRVLKVQKHLNEIEMKDEK
jgi:hypothetical protein